MNKSRIGKYFAVGAGVLAIALGGILASDKLKTESGKSSSSSVTIFCSEFKPLMESSSVYAKWASQNRSERDKWLAFSSTICLNQQPVYPVLSTSFGKALLAAGKMALLINVPPGTTTTTTTQSTTTTTTTQPPVTAVPSIPSGLSAVAGDGQVSLSWSANPAAESVDFYQVYKNDQTLILNVSGTSYVATGLVNGTSYGFRISAHNVASANGGYGDWTNAITVTPNGPPPTTTTTTTTPPPGNRYTDINFAAGLYAGEGIEGGGSIFEAYQSDPRLSSWGGTDPACYDNPASCGLSPTTVMTTDLGQRVHLIHPSSVGLPNLAGSTWASWQELRTTDGPWESSLSAPNRLAKASINISKPATFNASWQFGLTRWFAYDILFPLNIVGSTPAAPVSFQQSTTFQSLGDLHSSDSGLGADPGLCVLRDGKVQWRTTWDPRGNVGVPYQDTDLLTLWDGSGNRVVNQFNVWHEVVVGMKLTADNTAWYEVWFDGVQKRPQTFRRLLDPSEGGPYFQLQNYTAYDNSGYVGGATRSAVVYGGFRAGMTRADVQTR